MLSPTAFLAAAMQCAASIHPSTAFDVAKVESGFNPYAIAEIVPKQERTPAAPVSFLISPPTMKWPSTSSTG
ncbi:Type IV secretion system protein virB1 [Dickeya solani]|nr:Type IV secretion system protein virB1 [Dickeya solani]